MDQALQLLVVAAHAKVMTHMQTILCEKGAAIKILCNTLSISLAAHTLWKRVSVIDTSVCKVHTVRLSKVQRSTLHQAQLCSLLCLCTSK